MKKMSGKAAKKLDNARPIGLLEPITTGDIQAALEEAMQDLAGTVLSDRPPGAFTVKEYAEAFDPPLPVATAAGHLTRGARAGKYELLKAYHISEDGRRSPHNFYRKVSSKQGVTPCMTGQPSTISSPTLSRRSTKR
jgi:hypothetical protein